MVSWRMIDRFDYNAIQKPLGLICFIPSGFLSFI